MNSLADDLRFAMITSSAKVYKVSSDSEQKIVVSASQHKKCERCWHYRADIGLDAEHPTICGRCVSNLFGNGEARKYAWYILCRHSEPKLFLGEESRGAQSAHLF